MNNPPAIWYVPQFKEWAIGSISKIGTNWRGISSNGQSEWDCPHLVPNENWDYYDQNDGWITAVGEKGSINVQCNMGASETQHISKA